jgi:crotonobetainyl-CoA:carnitine CoA-transferase CaiB-like acyl-CoA transferase
VVDRNVKSGTSSLQPLAGIRILDLSQALAGPMAGRILADLGADVIKVEPPVTGESARRMGTTFIQGESLYYMQFNRNKRGITLDLQTPEGKEIFHRLVCLSDAVLENFRPGVTRRLGVDYDTLKKFNPSIIYGALSGYGQDGPYSDRPLFDSVGQALSGAMSVTGEPNGPPAVMGFAVVDIGGGYGAALGLLAALLSRERTGVGSYLDVSLLDINMTFQGHLSEMYLGSGNVPGRGGSVQSANLPNGAFRTSDGRYLQLHCATQKFHDVLVNTLAANVKGLESLPDDERFKTLKARQSNWSLMKEVLDRAFATKTLEEWLHITQSILPIAPVNTIGEAFQDPQVLHRNMMVEADHPVAGKYKMVGNPIKLGQDEAFCPAPTLGQHNAEILTGLLGYSLGEIASLRDHGII